MSKSEEKTNEERSVLCYQLGQVERAARDGAPKAAARVARMVRKAVRLGAMADATWRGEQWMVAQMDSPGCLMPGGSEERHFTDKGICFLYWLGLGRPEDAVIVSMANPAELEAMVGLGPGAVAAVTDGERPRVLRVLPGGRRQPPRRS
jgi:hypothetical protein